MANTVCRASEKSLCMCYRVCTQRQRCPCCSIYNHMITTCQEKHAPFTKKHTTKTKKNQQKKEVYCITIEEKLVRQYGVTDMPELCVWMLRDGTMVNGSYEGHQRDIDHRCISEYFKRSKFEDPGSALIYVKKFMRRGNIRYGCSDFGYCIELTQPPSSEQFAKIQKHMRYAIMNHIDTCIGRYDSKHKLVYETWRQYTAYLARYTSLIRRKEYYFDLI